MIFAPTDPLRGRDSFKSRSFYVIAVLIALFIPTVAILSWQISISIPGILPMLLGDAVAIGFAYCLYNVWNTSPIRLRCPECQKIILTNTPWVCGFCKEPNRNANVYPFVRECGHCHDEPKAYRCHHHDCGKLVFFSEDRDTRNYAYCLNAPNETTKAEEQAGKQKNKEDKLHEIEIAELELKLKAIKERRDGPKIKTPFEAKKEHFERDYEGSIGIQAYVAKRKAEVAIEYKDHPDLLKDALEMLDHLKEKYSL